MHTFLSFFPILVVICSVSLSLSQIEHAMEPKARKSTLVRNPLGSGSFSSDLVPPSPCLVLWWEGPKGLLGELPETWCSFRAPSYSIRLSRHSTTWCYSDLRMGISMWETRAVSRRVYIGVLLRYTWHRYLCTLVFHYILRYTYRNYPGSYIWGITCSAGSASWLPQLYASPDCVQRQASVSLF